MWRDLEVPEIDLAALPERVDVVVSHTLPQSIAMMVVDRTKGTMDLLEARGWDMSPDPMEKALEGVLERCKPSLWLAGHFHRFVQGVTSEGCQWTALGAVAWWQPALIWLDWLEPYDSDYVAAVMVALRREAIDGWR